MDKKPNSSPDLEETVKLSLKEKRASRIFSLALLSQEKGDIKKARELLKKAMEAGNKEAKKVLDSLEPTEE